MCIFYDVTPLPSGGASTQASSNAGDTKFMIK